MTIAVFVVGLLLSAGVIFKDLRPDAPQVKRLPLELHFVAAMISGAGAGLAWGSVWGIVAFIAQAALGVLASMKLRG